MRQAAGCDGLLQFWRAPLRAIVHVLNWALKRSVVSMDGLIPVEIVPPEKVVAPVELGVPVTVPPPVVGAGIGNPDWKYAIPFTCHPPKKMFAIPLSLKNGSA